jgi:hypothetical protein
MITIFYKIIHNDEVVYVGVTTQTIQRRLLQHKKSKHLDDSYTIEEICRIVHPKIDSLEVYYKERIKVVELERKLIQEEKDKGSNLLNISVGGEWGNRILNKLVKDNFFKKYGSYDGYEEYKKRRNKAKEWIRNWIRHKSENKTKVWIRNWILNKSKNKTKVWIRSWITVKSRNKTKAWIKSWILNKSRNKTKVWIGSWITVKSRNKTKEWIRNWIRHESENKTEE